MYRPYLPIREAELVRWTKNFLQVATALRESIGISSEQLAALATVIGAWLDAYHVATRPETRTSVSLVTKDGAKREMLTMVRQIVRIIQACPTTTDTMRLQLGITVPKTPGIPDQPETPHDFKVEIGSIGTLHLKWKNRNATGCVYDIYRKLGAEGEVVWIGRATKRRFVDQTIPAGTCQIQYQVQAVRPSGMSARGIFPVRIGGVPVMQGVSESDIARLAA